jgi:hypothetical protein
MHNHAHSTMHPAYFQTQFRARSLPDAHQWPDEFCIITACATTGEVWSEARNRAADRRLARLLKRSGCWRIRLTGFSPDSGHAEPGWAAAIPFDMACDLGQRFRQDAIYYVRRNTLFVSYCDNRRSLKRVRKFSASLSLAPLWSDCRLATRSSHDGSERRSV